MAANEDLGSVVRRQKSVSLDKWPVFCLMSEKFVQNIHSFIIYGDTGSDVIVVTKEDVVFHMNVNNITKTLELKQLSGKGIIKITAGSKHLCALTSAGDVYAWGENNYCQLGTGNTNPSIHPLKVSLDCNNEKIVDIECGSLHTLALTDAGHVYTWGYNCDGNGYDYGYGNQSTPIQVMGGLDGCHVTSIVCGGYHSLAVTDTGSVFGWGHNVNGQLGLGNTTGLLLPVQIQYFNDIKVIKVVCGPNHTIFLSDKGNVYLCGLNGNGQLGTGDKVTMSSPFKLNAINQYGPIVDIVAHISNTISAAVTVNGEHFVWGDCRQPFGDLLTPQIVNIGSIDDIIGLYGKIHACYHSTTIGGEEVDPVVNSLSKAFDDPITSSFKFVIDGHPIHVHREYLIIRCERLNTLLDTKSKVLELKDYTYDAFKAFLRYLYTNEVIVAPDIGVELLGLADTYGETDLKRKCTRVIYKGIAIENVVTIYLAAVKHSVPELQDLCFNYVMIHFKEVFKTNAFKRMDIDIRMDFLCRYTVNAGLL